MHATIMAVVLWSIAAVALSTGSGYRSSFGSLKGTDFIHFYTLGHMDSASVPAILYDPEAVHRLQTTLVPASAPERYLVAYPPHIVLLFRPFASLSYGAAYAVWSLIVAAGYSWCIRVTWRPARSILSDSRLIAAAAAAFPPFWSLILHGQTTLVPLFAFCLAWMALERGRRFWAGAALGLLLLKPQFAVVLAVVVVFWREWTMMLGAIVSVAIQIGTTIAAFGVTPLKEYASVVANLGGIQAALEPRPTEMHSLSAITNHLPGFFGPLVWAGGAIFIVTNAVRAWRAPTSLSLRMACVVLASLLVNPHVNSYDATVLALPLVWYAGWLYGAHTSHSRVRAMFEGLVYALYVTLLAPTARVIMGVQVSVILLIALFVLMTRAVAQASVASAAGSMRHSMDAHAPMQGSS